MGLGQLIFKNTATNYLLLGARMVSAVILTRIVFLGLGDQYYGFWTLLWAIFGYSLLLDFGFGKTVQKYTAEATFTNDVAHYSRILSAVFFSYLSMSLLIISFAFVMMFFIQDIFVLPPGANIWYYRLSFILFGIGISGVFPGGIFPEILVGMKRHYLRNYIMLINTVLEFAGVYLIIKLNGSLLSLAIFAAIPNLITNTMMGVAVFKLIPGLKISFSGLNMKTIREIADFSLFAYIVSIAEMIIFKSDRIVLGVMVGLTGVTVYQLGTRIPEIMSSLTMQFQENIPPLVASIHKSGDRQKLQDMLFNSIRFTVFLSTCALVIFGMLARQIMHAWLKVSSNDVMFIVYLMLFSVFIMVAFRSSSINFLQMAGRHRLVAILYVVESIANLGLSILLVSHFGVPGVAFGTLIPNFIISVFIVFPLAAKFCEQSIWSYVWRVYIPAFLIGIPAALFLKWITSVIPLNEWNLLLLVLAGPIAGLLYLLPGWAIFVNKTEKAKLLSVVPFIPHGIKSFLGGSAPDDLNP
ncbi:MAG: polysaccharide biosynthesis C-terminal domain-containing protein [Lentisphaerota bacterium]